MDLRVPNINQSMIAGRLTRDPEFRVTPSGHKILQFRIAWSRTYNGKEQKLFIDVVAWNKLAEWAEPHLKKAFPVIVIGQLVTDEWTDIKTSEPKSKITLTAHRIEFLAKPAGAGETAAGKESEFSGPSHAGPEDDIPF